MTSESQSDPSAEEKRPQFGGRHLKDEGDVFKHNAWDDVEWDEDQMAAAKEKVAANARVSMTPEERKRLEAEADKHWDDFYATHNAGFFKDRNWLFTEFPELLKFDGEKERRAVLEVGCGAGNTVFPLLERLKGAALTVYCCDFSPNAVNLVRGNKDFEPERCSPFVLDATMENWESEVPFAEESLDCILLIFTMSAMDPTHMKSVAANLHKYLKPGGLVLFRDYGLYDLAQLRFKSGRCIAGNNFYARGDGTRCFFFSQSDVRDIFSSEAGFEEVQNRVDSRLQVNRGKQMKMYRVWIQAKYRKSS